jgi:aspartyl-tRNA(Asn)/glutamyl-tRNA(Gln) amidotransferase subunit C
MAIDTKQIRDIAALARIAVDGDEVETLKADLNTILDWVERLAELDTSNVAPLASVTGAGMTPRADEITDGGYPDDIVANAPRAQGHFFIVPKVVE